MTLITLTQLKSMEWLFSMRPIVRLRESELGSGDTVSIQFPRHEQGEYVPLGKYMKPPDKLTFKYADEVRKCYGVAKIKTPSGEVKGEFE